MKCYVLDTNVLIQTPTSMDVFEENQIVIPLVVVEELDRLKTAEGEKGANARKAIRRLENLRQTGDLLEGVMLENGGSLRIEKNFIDVQLPPELPDNMTDNRILQVCFGLTKNQDIPVTLVTKDILLRLKAQLVGLSTQDFMAEQVEEHEKQYHGRTEAYVPEELFKDFKKKGIPCDYAYSGNPDGTKQPVAFFENQFVTIHADQSAKKHIWRVSRGTI